MKYYIWLLRDKTNVPFKHLETEDCNEFFTEFETLHTSGKRFATRSE